jgi:hypothetical protein
MREIEIARGQREFAAIFAIGAGMFLVLGLAAWLRTGELALMATFGRPVVLVGLGLLAWEGQEWARTAATVWLGLIAIVTLFSAVAVAGASVLAALAFFVVGLGVAALAFRLQASSAIDAALTARQRALRARVDPPAA